LTDCEDRQAVRIVSLVPSVTETLLAWGIVPVAVTRFCEQPGLATVGGTKDPDVAAIVALAPDLVVVDKEENRLDDARALTAAGLEVHALHVTALGEVATAMEGLATSLGLDVEVPDPFDCEPIRLCAFVPIWRRPWMSINSETYGSSLLAAAGVANVLAGSPERYPVVTLEQAALCRPDLVLAPSEPYPFGERQRVELERVAPVVFVDGRDLFWWGARTPGALGRIKALVDGAATTTGRASRR
jgi:ABC-type Fe3+-hydroxamate transport system substrate-binding protein